MDDYKSIGSSIYLECVEWRMQ